MLHNLVGGREILSSHSSNYEDYLFNFLIALSQLHELYSIKW
jgi:hypothetical protein